MEEWSPHDTPHDSSTGTDELMRLYDEIEELDSERQRKCAAVARLLEGQRPNSFVSAASTASRQSSKRSTQGSFASSRTSCSSTTSHNVLSKFPLPPVTEEAVSSNGTTLVNETGPASSLRGRLQKHLQPGRSPSASRSSVSSVPDASPKSSGTSSRTRWCPWCQQSFTRPNDFKKHVMQYCCGTTVFMCRNPDCRNLSSQEKLAKDHSKASDSVQCRQQKPGRVQLQCKRQHFGCGYCSVYFDDLDKFIEHFGGTCRPDQVQKRYQQSRQIRALLQQPPLLSLVENSCLQLRGYKDAYKALWWTWKSHRMNQIIRDLEYGPKPKVDIHNPGIAHDRVAYLLKMLIEPSSGSVYAAEIIAESPPSEKELPPIPYRQEPFRQEDSQPGMAMQWESNDIHDDTSTAFGDVPIGFAQDEQDGYAYFPQGDLGEYYPPENFADWSGTTGRDTISQHRYAWDGLLVHEDPGPVVDQQWQGRPDVRGNLHYDQHYEGSSAAQHAAVWASLRRWQ